MNPKFSILTPNYNCARYLDDWGPSILAQNYRPLEVIFVDDCSDDGSLDKAAEWYTKFAAVGIEMGITKSEKRSYYGTGCKTAFALATGDFFGTLDADDIIKPGSVDYVMSLYQKYTDIAWIYTKFQMAKQDMTISRQGFSCAPNPGESLLSMGLKGHHTYSHWRTWSRRVPKPHKLFVEGQRCSVDKYLGYRLEELAQGAFAPTVCYLWRTGSKQSISLSEPSKQMWKQVMKEAANRRQKYGVKPIPVRSLKEKVQL
jgi:glycosyltransferase involved in cell wall biosynthesis